MGKNLGVNDKLIAAKYFLNKKAPILEYLRLGRMKTVLVGGDIPSPSRTNGRVLFLSRNEIENDLTEAELCGEMAHLMMHVIFEHPERFKTHLKRGSVGGKKFYPDVYELATDIQVNNVIHNELEDKNRNENNILFLKKEKYEPVKVFIDYFNKKYDKDARKNLNTDSVYLQLLQLLDSDGAESQMKAPSGGGQGSGQGQDQDQDDNQNNQGDGGSQGQQQSQNGSGQGQGQPDNLPGPNADKPSADAYEEYVKNRASNFDLTDPGGGNDLKTDLRRAVSYSKSALTGSTSRGTEPGFFAEIIEELNKAKVDWRTKLRSLIKRQITNRMGGFRNWRTPHRKALAQRNEWRPRRMTLKCNTILLGIDTSGSMSTELIVQCASEAYGLVQDLMPEALYICWTDAEVARVDKINDRDQLKRLLKEKGAAGRGGTSFDPVFDYARTMVTKPEALIYMTDGYAPPPSDPDVGCPVFWLVPERNPYDHLPGVIIQLPDESSSGL